MNLLCLLFPFLAFFSMTQLVWVYGYPRSANPSLAKTVKTLMATDWLHIQTCIPKTIISDFVTLNPLANLINSLYDRLCV